MATTRSLKPGERWPQRYTIKGGMDAVVIVTNEHGVTIQYGHDAINATIHLDYGEAREVASAILEGAEMWAGISIGRHES